MSYVCDIVFPLGQPGNCLASCLLRSPAPMNRQESHTVTMQLFTQLLLNSGSLKVEHQHILTSYSHSKRNITYTRSNQWGIMNPESQCLSLQVWETARWARISWARWATGQMKSSVQQGRASGGWCQGRSARHGAVHSYVELGCLNSGLEPASVIPWKWCTPSFWVFTKCLGIPNAKWGICPGAYGRYMAVLLDTPAVKWGIFPGGYLWVVLLCRHGCSDHMCRYLRCVSLPDVLTLA